MAKGFLGRLFQSQESKLQEADGRRRRITYLKRKYSKSDINFDEPITKKRKGKDQWVKTEETRNEYFVCDSAKQAKVAMEALATRKHVN